MERKSWTTQEVDFLSRESASLSLKEIAEKLDRPVKMVRWKIKQLGLTNLDGRTGKSLVKWTPDKLEWLTEQIATRPAATVADELNLTAGGLADVLHRYGIKGRGVSRKHTPDEIEKRIAPIRGVPKPHTEAPTKFTKLGQICVKCDIDKSLDDYYHSTLSYANGIDRICKECRKDRRKTIWKEDISGNRSKDFARRASRTPEEVAAFNLLQTKQRLWNNFKLTLEQYEEMVELQHGLCKMCGNPETKIHHHSGEIQRLAVDHDHSCCPGQVTCGKCIRGLLCTRCNWLLGKIEQEPDLEHKIVEYLSKGPIVVSDI